MSQAAARIAAFFIQRVLYDRSKMVVRFSCVVQSLKKAAKLSQLFIFELRMIR